MSRAELVFAELAGNTFHIYRCDPEEGGLASTCGAGGAALRHSHVCLRVGPRASAPGLPHVGAAPHLLLLCSVLNAGSAAPTVLRITNPVRQWAEQRLAVCIVV